MNIKKQLINLLKYLVVMMAGWIGIVLAQFADIPTPISSLFASETDFLLDTYWELHLLVVEGMLAMTLMYVACQILKVRLSVLFVLVLVFAVTRHFINSLVWYNFWDCLLQMWWYKDYLFAFLLGVMAAFGCIKLIESIWLYFLDTKRVKQ